MTSRASLSAVGRRVAVSRELGPLIGLIIAIVVFQVGSGGKFLAPIQITNVATIAAALAIIGTGVTMLIISGEFDLSVGTTFAFVPVVFGLLTVDWHFDPFLAFAIAMALAAVVGLINGFMTLFLHLPSFIATLGSFYALAGINTLLTRGLSTQLPDGIPLTTILAGKIFGSPVTMQVFWAALIIAFFWVVLERTRVGNWIFACGGRGGVARAMGVPTRRVKLSLFVLCSVLAGFAGCTVFARLGIVSGFFGYDYNLLAIVATVVGGTSLFGARGTILGTVIGAMLVSSLQPGLLVIGAGGTWYQAVTGALLVVAVLFNGRFERFRSSRVGSVR